MACRSLRALVALRIPQRGQIEKILQNQMPVLGGDAFGMELNAVHRQGAMREPHHQTVMRFGRDGEFVGQAVALDHERVVARGLERAVDAAKDTASFVADVAELAMDRGGRAYHCPAEGLADRLMAEADPE